MKNKVSVIVCVHNHDKWIGHCLNSLAKQKTKNLKYEVIVYDDASKDNTNQVLKKFKSKNFKILRNKKNLGLPTTLNKAIKKATGQFIVRVDSDDFVNKSFLNNLKYFLDTRKSFKAVACDYYEVNNKNKILKKIDSTKKQIACGILFDKSAMYKVGLYNPKFKMREGHEFRTRFLKKFKIGRLKRPLYYYRQHNKNRTKERKLLKKFDKMLKAI